MFALPPQASGGDVRVGIMPGADHVSKLREANLYGFAYTMAVESLKASARSDVVEQKST